jgi:hypothetical protein
MSIRPYDVHPIDTQAYPPFIMTTDVLARIDLYQDFPLVIYQIL